MTSQNPAKESNEPDRWLDGWERKVLTLKDEKAYPG